MSARDATVTQEYLHQALTQGVEIAISFLASLSVVTPDCLSAPPTLQPTPDGAYIISHVRTDNSSVLTTHQLRNLPCSPPIICYVGHHRHTDQNSDPHHHHYRRIPTPTDRTHTIQPSQKKHPRKSILGPLPKPTHTVPSPRRPYPHSALETKD